MTQVICLLCILSLDVKSDRSLPVECLKTLSLHWCTSVCWQEERDSTAAFTNVFSWVNTWDRGTGLRCKQTQPAFHPEKMRPGQIFYIRNVWGLLLNGWQWGMLASSVYLPAWFHSTMSHNAVNVANLRLLLFCRAASKKSGTLFKSDFIYSLSYHFKVIHFSVILSGNVCWPQKTTFGCFRCLPATVNINCHRWIKSLCVAFVLHRIKQRHVGLVQCEGEIKQNFNNGWPNPLKTICSPNYYSDY